MCFEMANGSGNLLRCCMTYLAFINARYFFPESFKPKVGHNYNGVVILVWLLCNLSQSC